MISNGFEKGKIKAVAAKDNITAIKIKSSGMLLAHECARYSKSSKLFIRASIDMIYSTLGRYLYILIIRSTQQFGRRPEEVPGTVT